MLREPTFLVLASLAPGPLHGYGIMQAVDELSEGRVTLRAGTLYGALDRLTSDDWLAVDREEIVDGRLRRYYRLTPAGSDALRREIERLESNAAVARQRLALTPRTAPA